MALWQRDHSWLTETEFRFRIDGEVMDKEGCVLERWARFAVRRRWWVLTVSLVVVVVLGVASSRFGGEFTDNFRIPGSESQRAFDLLEERFAREGGVDARVVWTVSGELGADGIFAPAVLEPIEALLAELEMLEGVEFVTSPYATGANVSDDARAAFATVRFRGQQGDVPGSSVERLLELLDGVRGPGLAIEAGGEVIAGFEQEGPGESELFGLAAAALVLLVAFGSIIAMGLPLVTALLGLAMGFFLIRFFALALDISTFAPSFAAMLGIGVGIDYALFVVTRFREGLAAGWSVEQSLVTAVSTAGRAVLFAGVVVVASLLGLYAIGIPFVANLGLSAAIVVGTAMIVAITVLPALLAMIGRNIDRWALPFLRPSAAGDPRGFWYRFSRVIQRRAMLFLVLGTGLLLLLSAPLLGAELGSSDDGNNSERFASRRAYDMLADAFGAGFNGPFVIVVNDTTALEPASLVRLQKAVSLDPNVDSVSSAGLSASGETAVFTVTPGTAPQDAATRDLVQRLRAETVPGIMGRLQGSPEVFVAGATAAFSDMTERVESRLAPFFAVVIGFALVLLSAAFRSVAVPIKAAIMNLFAISASLGVIVAIFQWGWGLSLLGIDRSGPIESFLPMFMFAILFGLSMDYEVFLLSRIRERYLQTGDASASVAHGISASARVITAAAAILVTVFLSFMLGDSRVIKEFGLGLAFAIFIDATLVRLVLVPAAMELMGRWTWWMPAWLDRLLPGISIDPPAVEPKSGPEPAPEAALPPLPEPTSDVAPEPSRAPQPSFISLELDSARTEGPSAVQLPQPATLGNREAESPLRWVLVGAALVVGFVTSYRLPFATQDDD